MAKILKGKPVAESILERLGIIEQERKLGILRIGYHPGSTYYIRSITKTADTVGISVETLEFEKGTGEEEVKKALKALAQSKRVNGILIMEPLPKNININELIE
ncbi:MAG: tetrahydrofolate dehydrogenase/cyclohydrolase catalytic domain-containing protein, partial [candidate division WOR-3 bacterium]